MSLLQVAIVSFYHVSADLILLTQGQVAASGSRLWNYFVVSHPPKDIWVLSWEHPALGANVTAHYNSQFGPIQELLASNTNLQHVQANLSEEQAVVTMFKSLSTMPHGPVQVVVINHAISHSLAVPIARMTLDQWNTTMTVNLTSSFLVCREYLKHLERASSDIKEKATIILVGSTAGKYGEANNGDYAVTKSGQ